MFVRETKIRTGSTVEVAITPCSEIKRARAAKEIISSPAQKNLNDKNAKKYFKQLMRLNFGAGDFHVSLTYRDEFLPDSVGQAEKTARNYIKRVKYYAASHGIKGEMKYLIGSSVEVNELTGELSRPHHHLIISSGVPREVLEDLWRMPRRRGQKSGEAIGFANADRLSSFGDRPLEKLADYITGKRNTIRPRCKRRWSSSLNLKKPEKTINDRKYSLRTLRKLAMTHGDDRAFWERRYPGYICISARAEYYDERGWGIYLVLERKKS